MMKMKKITAALLGLSLMAVLGACGAKTENTQTAATTAAAMTESSAAAPEQTAAVETTGAQTADADAETTQAESSLSADTVAGEALRVGSLKGPTTMGLVQLMAASEAGTAQGKYTFSMSTQPDELVAAIASGKTDIALVPANLAAVIYQKTKGAVSVIDINTLGVLECVTGDASVKGIADLAGKTILTTGQGATPEYVLRYLLDAYGVKDAKLEFKSEPTEIAALLKNDPNQLAVLPQPFATAAQLQNEQLKSAFSLTKAWEEIKPGTQLLTGVTIVRKEVLEQQPEAVKLFVTEHSQSAQLANDKLDETAELVVKYGVLDKAPLAKKALPACNIVCISGADMKAQLEVYLQVLYEQNPKAVGGQLPAADFYAVS